MDKEVIIIEDNITDVSALEYLLITGGAQKNNDVGNIPDIIDQHTCTLNLIISDNNPKEPFRRLVYAMGILLNKEGYVILNYHLGSADISFREWIKQDDRLKSFDKEENYELPHVILLYHLYSGIIAPIKILAYFRASKETEPNTTIPNDIILGKIDIPKDFKLDYLPISSSIPDEGETLHLPDKRFPNGLIDMYGIISWSNILDTGTFSLTGENKKKIEYTQKNPEPFKKILSPFFSTGSIFYARPVTVGENIPRTEEDKNLSRVNDFINYSYGYPIIFKVDPGLSGTPLINGRGECAGIITANGPTINISSGGLKLYNRYTTQVVSPLDIKYLIQECVTACKMSMAKGKPRTTDNQIPNT